MRALFHFFRSTELIRIQRELTRTDREKKDNRLVKGIVPLKVNLE